MESEKVFGFGKFYRISWPKHRSAGFIITLNCVAKYFPLCVFLLRLEISENSRNLNSAPRDFTTFLRFCTLSSSPTKKKSRRVMQVIKYFSLHCLLQLRDRKKISNLITGIASTKSWVKLSSNARQLGELIVTKKQRLKCTWSGRGVLCMEVFINF